MRIVIYVVLASVLTACGMVLALGLGTIKVTYSPAEGIGQEWPKLV